MITQRSNGLRTALTGRLFRTASSGPPLYHVKLVWEYLGFFRGYSANAPLRAIRVRTALHPVIPARFSVPILVRGNAVSGCL